MEFIILGVAPMVQDAKQVAMDTNNPAACSRWRDSNRGVSFVVFDPVTKLPLKIS